LGGRAPLIAPRGILAAAPSSSSQTGWNHLGGGVAGLEGHHAGGHHYEPTESHDNGAHVGEVVQMEALQVVLHPHRDIPPQLRSHREVIRVVAQGGHSGTKEHQGEAQDQRSAGVPQALRGHLAPHHLHVPRGPGCRMSPSQVPQRVLPLGGATATGTTGWHCGSSSVPLSPSGSH